MRGEDCVDARQLLMEPGVGIEPKTASLQEKLRPVSPRRRPERERVVPPGTSGMKVLAPVLTSFSD